MICCPLEGYSDGPSASTTVIRKARKEHCCQECRETIALSQRYEYVSGIWDGKPDSFKTCLSCVEIRNHFQCDGWIIGQLWSDLEDNFFPNMTAGGPCMDGLSPTAKARLFERRTAWLLARGDES